MLVQLLLQILNWIGKINTYFKFHIKNREFLKNTSRDKLQLIFKKANTYETSKNSLHSFLYYNKY